MHISEALIPETSKNLDIVQIIARAEETNGCWRDLYFVLEKKSEFEYSLKAKGTFESNGVCPTVMVYQDTIIEFKPKQKGTYYFKIIQSIIFRQLSNFLQIRIMDNFFLWQI